MPESDYVKQKNGVIKKRKTHCKHGHRFDGTERWHTNWRGFKCRVCRACAKERMRRKRENPDFLAIGAARTKKWRAENVEEARKRARDQYRRRDQWIQAFKTKCTYCDESRFPCLDFHHRDPSEKDLTIAASRHLPQDVLAAEIAKCDVVCANCHRWLHWLEKQKTRKEGATT